MTCAFVAGSDATCTLQGAGLQGRRNSLACDKTGRHLRHRTAETRRAIWTLSTGSRSCADTQQTVNFQQLRSDVSLLTVRCLSSAALLAPQLLGPSQQRRVVMSLQ